MLLSIIQALSIWLIAATATAFFVGGIFDRLSAVPKPAPAVRAHQSSASNRSDVLVNS